jgi:muconolactone delta-isomerase
MSEYLVTMTTHVPDGTSEQSVDVIKAREAVRAGELAAEGHLLRLWRPPLQPGEWRTLGLFAADDDVSLEKNLASMPLRVWRTDEVTPLSPHPNDPGPRPSAPEEWSGTEFLTTFALAIPTGTPASLVDETQRREARRARQLAVEGRLLRLWRLPEEARSLGLWRVSGASEIGEILASLPLADWLTVETLALSRHPSDPSPALRSGLP